MHNVVIIGGGIAGLATAFRLQQTAKTAGLPIQCHLIEGTTRFGGKVVTDRQDGFLVEGGPDSIIPHKPWALELIRDLGLGDRLLPSNDARRGLFVLHGGELVPLPEGLPLLAPTRWGAFLRSPLLPWSAKLRFAAERWVPPRQAEDDETLAAFVRRRFGKGALGTLAEPILAHIHVGDIERMSLRATYPRLAELETHHGSLQRGAARIRAKQRAASPSPPGATAGGPKPPVFWTLKGGMAELIETLTQRIDTTSQTLGHRVVTLDRSPGTVGNSPRGRERQERFSARLDDGRQFAADAVVLATPAFAAADLMAETEPNLAGKLRTIPYVSMATLSLGYRRADVAHTLEGFGFFVPRREAEQVLACTWASTKFDHRAPGEDVLLRVFLGGTGKESLLDLEDTELVYSVQRDLTKIMGITAEPCMTKLYRWPRGYPQYEIGHLERVADIETALPRGLFIAGSAYHGVGLPDCIHSGFRVAEQIVAYLRTGT